MTEKKRTYMSVSEAARELDLSGQQVRRLADRGDIESQRTPLGRLLTRKSVMAEKKRRESGR